MILLLFLLRMLFSCENTFATTSQEGQNLNNVRINYRNYSTVEDSFTYNYKHIYIKDGMIQEVHFAYIDSFRQAYYFRDKDSVFQVIEYMEPNYSEQPYFLKKEGQKIFAIVVQPDTTYRHLQYSLNRNDTTLWFDSPHQFSQEFMYSLLAPKCSYSGVDTILIVGSKSFKCYKFNLVDEPDYFRGTRDYRTIYLEQSTFLPFLMIWNSYNKKNELVYHEIEAAYEITPTNGFIPEVRKPQNEPDFNWLKGK